LPRLTDETPDELTSAILLPGRRTRALYAAFGVVLGAAIGLAYARFIVDDAGTLWMVAAAAVGAVAGVTCVLMPAMALKWLRRLMTRLVLSLNARRLTASIRRAERALEARIDSNEEDAEAWNGLGILKLVNGEVEEAREALQRACELNGNRYCVNLGVALAREGELFEAAEILSSPDARAAGEVALHNLGVLLSKSPPDPVVERVLESLNGAPSAAIFNRVGVIHLEAGRLEAAERHFKRAIEADPSAVAPRANMALVAYRRGDIRGAISLLDEAASLDPVDPVIADNLGAMLCLGGRPALAMRQLSRAAALAPGSPAVELNRGVVRLTMGKYEDALDTFSEAHVRAAWPVEAVHDAALALIGLDRHEKAIERLEAAVERHPHDAPLWNNLGCLYWAAGDDARMVEAIERAGAEETFDPAIAFNQVLLAISSGDIKSARPLLERLEPHAGQDQGLRLARGIALMVEALDDYQPQMSAERRQEFFRRLHGCLRPLEVVAQSEAAESVEARLNLALFYYLRRELESAIEVFEDLARERPRDGFIHYCLGTALMERAAQVQAEHEAEGEDLVPQARALMKRARQHLKSAAENGHDTADTFCNLGMAAYDLGDMNGAREAFRRMVQVEESPDAFNNLAIVHAMEAQRLQKSARAASLASRVRESEMLQDAQTHISTALHYFLKALEFDRTDPVLHGNIGLAYMMRNREQDVENALRHWQRMLDLGGAEQRRRYEQLTAMAHGQDARAAFDETIMSIRPLDPRRCLAVPPPRLCGPRCALRMVIEDIDWRFVTDDPRVQRVLENRERVAGLRKRLVRLNT